MLSSTFQNFFRKNNSSETILEFIKANFKKEKNWDDDANYEDISIWAKIFLLVAEKHTDEISQILFILEKKLSEKKYEYTAEYLRLYVWSVANQIIKNDIVFEKFLFKKVKTKIK